MADTDRAKVTPMERKGACCRSTNVCTLVMFADFTVWSKTQTLIAHKHFLCYRTLFPDSRNRDMLLFAETNIYSSEHKLIYSMSHVMPEYAERPLSLSYQKKDWQEGPRQSSFCDDTDYYEICSLHSSQILFYSRCHTKWRIGGPCQSFFWYDNDKEVCFSLMWVILFLLPK